MSSEYHNNEIITAENVGIKFNANVKRDDIKSLSFDLLFKKRKKENVFWALQDVSFSGFTGEVIGIIGSNGAGKTTLCRVITEIYRPDTGKIDVKGEVSALLSMGTGFNRNLSGRDNIYLNGMMLGMSKKEVDSFYEKIYEFSGLGRFINQPIKHYSSGMRSRLGFSIAAMMEPEVLVLDEALNPGDIEFKDRATMKIKELVSHAKLVIIVSHNVKLISKACTKAIWVDAGRIRAQGKPKDIIAQYRKSIPITKKKKRVLNLQQTKTKVLDHTVVSVSKMGIRFKANNKEFWPLRDINFIVNEGEILGIIGHNGAGKSTLCRVLTEIYRPDEGAVTVEGKTTALLSFGTGFNRQLSARDNIILNGMMLGISRRKIVSLCDEIIEFAGLGQHIDKPIKNYSSGMKARLGFSIAAAVKPDIFIIDEALSTGDMEFHEKASERIQEMITTANAVIVVTHNMRFVETVCTRAIWIDHGRLKFDGDPKRAVEMYTHHAKSK